MFVSIWLSRSMIPKYAQVANDAAATIDIILRSGRATSVFSFSFAGIYFSELSQTASDPVIAPVTTDISEACCVVKSGCESAHSMHLMYTPVMHSIMNLGSILSSNSFLATSSALIR